MAGEPLVRLNLPKLNIEEITVTLYVRVDLDRFSQLQNIDPDAGRVIHHLARFSRQRQPTEVSAAVYRHLEDADRFLVEYYTRQLNSGENHKPTNATSGPFLSEFLATVIEIEMSSVSTEYIMSDQGYSARRLPFVFPILQDASTMYPVAPSHPPVDEISGLMGIKHSIDGDLSGYTIATSRLREEVQIVIGHPLQGEELSTDLGEMAIHRSTEILRSVGLLGSSK
jgi:hypothetical protein